MFGKAKTKVIDNYTAARIAEAMNCWAGKENRKQIITAREILKLTPVATHDPNGCLVFAYQWGDVTILARVFVDGRILVKYHTW